MDITAPSHDELDLQEGDEIGADLELLATVATAAALIAFGVTRRSLPGAFLAAAAVPLLYRGLSGDWPPPLSSRTSTVDGDTRVALGGARGVHVREAIQVEKPVAEVFGFWRQLENLPRFMTYLEEVTDLGGGRSHWRAKGPAGRSVVWDAEIINEVENEVIGWRSLPGGEIVSAGSVNFKPVRGGQSTQLSVHLQYSPPAGKWGAVVAKLFGREPSQTIREDLRRLKQVLETGEIARAAADRT